MLVQQPGGAHEHVNNATGFSALEYGFGGKWLELLKEIGPAGLLLPGMLPYPRESAGLVRSIPWRQGLEWN
jgi:hypothetical protein